MRSIDVHQHLWPEAVLRVLEKRGAPPKATWAGNRWRVDLPGEPSFRIDPNDHDPHQRAAELNVDRAIFALLGGLAPLHAERTDQRKQGAGTEAALADQLTFYDTSSYGPRAVRAMATAVGIGQLVHGTDHPTADRTKDPVDEAFGVGFAELVKTAAPNRALGYTWVPHERTAGLKATSA